MAKQGLVLAAAVAMAAAPAVVSAQSSTGGSSSQGNADNSQQQQRGGGPSGGTQGGSAQQSGQRANGPVPIMGHFDFPLAAGCTYHADVNGRAQPASGTDAATGEPRYTANVTIDASVACPSKATIHVTDRLASTQPRTLTQIEEALETHSSLVAESQGLHCAYVPDFRLTEGRALEGVGAALLCPLPANAARGGGPDPSQNR